VFEATSSYTFNHVKKGDEVPLSEKQALEDFISHLKKVKMDKPLVIFTHSKHILAPLLLAKLSDFDLIDSFASVVRGICDFTSCISNLKLGGVWKETKFGDLVDVYRHIMGKQWPREPRHSDGVAVLSGIVLKKMMNDYSDYLEVKKETSLSIKKFLHVCGLRTVGQLKVDLAKAILKDKETDANRSEVKELELRPSDRPGEITIVTLKRFECFEVLDVDEVEEEGINEDDYFDTEGLAAAVMEKTVIKPGFVIPVKMKIKMDKANTVHSNNEFRCWNLVAKNVDFGAEADTIVKLEGDLGKEQKRIKHARKCGIARQIVEVKRGEKSVDGDESISEDGMIVMAKILNPTDNDIELHVGDEVATSKLEKGPDPENPERKTYSQIKIEAEAAVRRAEEEQDERERQKIVDERKRKEQKKKKKKRNEDKLNKKINLLDMDALDFEPVASDESFDEENISSDEDNMLTGERSGSSMSISESEEEGEVREEMNESIQQSINEQERSKSSNVNWEETNRDKSRFNESSNGIEVIGEEEKDVQ
jgi:hypothetical protein